jgi:hypothetical protein
MPRGLRIGRISRLVSPGYGWCYKCRTTWNFVEGHITNYKGGRGCFPLCEKCWWGLGTPEARLPYYRMLWDSWTSMGGTEDKEWSDIERAVLEGK